MKIIGHYVLQELGDDYVLMPAGNDPRNYKGMCSFNETGAFIWRLLEKQKSEDALLDAVTNVYDIDREGARRDVDNFLSRLESIKIIER